MKIAKAIIIFAIIALPIIAFFLFKKPSSEIPSIQTFSSEEDFKHYLEKASSETYISTFFRGLTAAEISEIPLEGEVPARISTTNVQVAGIDEPDMVKTDGKNIYLSSQSYRIFWIRRIPPRYFGETKVIKSFPPQKLELKSKINESGDLLLHQNNLIIFSWDKIISYNISNPESPSQSWKIKLNGSIVTSRLYNDKIYLVTTKEIDDYHPCPIIPLSINERPLVIGCSKIYHPTSYVPVDSTYHVFVINPNSGEIENSISFVGSYYSSVVYMSENSIYITYSQYLDYFTFYTNFLKEKCSDLIPSYVMEKIEKLNSYDISIEAKFVELQSILSKYMNSLDKDERVKLENELGNRMQNYSKEHMRDLVKSGIVKVGLNMEIKALGSVPGLPLNQFSLDEYQGYLRIATTVGLGSESANDVYILDSNLNLIGSIKDLGLGERIYSVRFIQDKGYVVTFRQVDPFYVLDLSQPSEPKMRGELKIPGYSSYLHPIAENRILGIGMDEQKVKVSLFDVSSAENPREIDKYTLSESWSDILRTHHAFLLDSKHKIFFLPGSRGGYVFSYDNDKLELKKVVSEIEARRAIYIEDYLYVIGEDKIVVVDEITWEKINEIEF
ncbi:MAG: beta-propeller domain-containing protein [Candidatus Aenigmatarchaeota archaeon]